jgi:hypothetical protein
MQLVTKLAAYALRQVIGESSASSADPAGADS